MIQTSNGSKSEIPVKGAPGATSTWSFHRRVVQEGSTCRVFLIAVSARHISPG